MDYIKAITCITDNYDEYRKHPDITRIKAPDKFKRPVYNAKYPKILPHLFINAKYSIWVDGNITLTKPLNYYLSLLGDKDMLIFKHPYRNNIIEEINELGRIKQFNQDSSLMDDLTDQISHYNFNYGTDYLQDIGLYECNFILRRHSKKMEYFNNEWWANTTRFGYRDQISFPVVLSEYNLKVQTYPGINIRSHTDFSYKKHLK